jgi:hypothetical protein
MSRYICFINLKYLIFWNGGSTTKAVWHFKAEYTKFVQVGFVYESGFFKKGKTPASASIHACNLKYMNRLQLTRGDPEKRWMATDAPFRGKSQLLVSNYVLSRSLSSKYSKVGLPAPVCYSTSFRHMGRTLRSVHGSTSRKASLAMIPTNSNQVLTWRQSKYLL